MSVRKGTKGVGRALPSRWEIASFWAARKPLWVVDLGEPACFACGHFKESWDRRKRVPDRWNRSELERAHIIAKGTGGSNEPSNLVLLCSFCHGQAPMTTFPAIMERWIDQPRASELISRVQAGIEDAQQVLEAPLPEVTPEQLGKTAKALGVSLHSTSITSGSISAIIQLIAAAQPPDT